MLNRRRATSSSVYASSVPSSTLVGRPANSDAIARLMPGQTSCPLLSGSHDQRGAEHRALRHRHERLCAPIGFRADVPDIAGDADDRAKAG